MGKLSFEDTFANLSKLQKLKKMQSPEYFNQAAKKAESLGVKLPKAGNTIKRGIPGFKYEVDERADALTQIIRKDDRFSKFRP